MRLSRGGRLTFNGGHEYDALLRMSVAELREALGIPPRGLAEGPRELHPDAPASGSA